eukprot:1894111-Pyramimonas_sp.AAC.3
MCDCVPRALTKRRLSTVADPLLQMMPPAGYPTSPITSLCAKFVHVSNNKRRYPVNVVLWTPDGRRLLTGAQNGEFTLWNGNILLPIAPT